MISFPLWALVILCTARICKVRYGPWQKVAAEEKKKLGIDVGEWLILRKNDGVLLPRLGHRKNQSLLFLSLLITYSAGSQLPRHEDTYTVLWRDPCGEELRPTSRSK